MATKQAKPGAKRTFETETVKQFGQTVQKQVIEGGGKDFLTQLLGLDLSTSSEKAVAPQTEKVTLQDPKTGAVEIYDVLKHKGAGEKTHGSEKPRKPEIRAHIDYAREISDTERFSKQEMREMDQQVKQIMDELKKLIQSSHILQVEFAEVAVEAKPVEVGKYHLNFFEWMLIVIRNAREKVENSGAWLSTVKGKGEKKGYWGMFKKHGTTFGMSNERSVATQTG